MLFCFLLFNFKKQRIKIENIKTSGIYVIINKNGIKEIYKIENKKIIALYNYSSLFTLRRTIQKNVNLSQCFKLNGNFTNLGNGVLITHINLSNACKESLRNLCNITVNTTKCIELYKKDKYIEISCKNLTIRMYLSNT